jgi:hypothetical protein
LERTVRDLYQSVVNEPVPQGLLDIVEQFPHARLSMAEAFERARRWRNKAEEIRTAAESMRSQSARQALLQVARNCETLAERVEKENRQGEDRERRAG